MTIESDRIRYCSLPKGTVVDLNGQIGLFIKQMPLDYLALNTKLQFLVGTKFVYINSEMIRLGDYVAFLQNGNEIDLWYLTLHEWRISNR